MQFGAIHTPAPDAVPHLATRARLEHAYAAVPQRIDWLAKCPQDFDALGNDSLGCCVPVVPFRRFQTLDANRTGTVTPIAVSNVIARYEMNGDYVPGDASTDNGEDTARDALNEVAAPMLGADGAPREVWWSRVNPGDQSHVAQALAQAPLSVTLALPVAIADNPERWASPPGSGWNTSVGFQHRVLLGALEDGYWTVVTWGLHVRIHPDLLLLPGFVLAIDVFLETDRLQDLTLAGLDYDAVRSDVRRILRTAAA